MVRMTGRVDVVSMLRHCWLSSSFQRKGATNGPLPPTAGDWLLFEVFAGPQWVAPNDALDRIFTSLLPGLSPVDERVTVKPRVPRVLSVRITRDRVRILELERNVPGVADGTTDPVVE